MGVISSNYGQGVFLTGKLAGLLDGCVEHDSLSQCQISCAQMVTTVDSATCRKPMSVSSSLSLSTAPSFHGILNTHPPQRGRSPWGSCSALSGLPLSCPSEMDPSRGLVECRILCLQAQRGLRDKNRKIMVTNKLGSEVTVRAHAHMFKGCRTEGVPVQEVWGHYP